MRSPLSAFLAVGLTLATAGLAGCAQRTPPSDDGKLAVVASFYPLKFLVQRIGGDSVRVTSLTKPGVEPHDLELTPRDVARLQDTGLVVYLSGFQPAVDDAIRAAGPRSVLDVAAAVHLTLTITALTAGDRAGRRTTDPHFWLDPVRMADAATAVEQRLALLRPADADLFARNLGVLRAELADLDEAFRTGLAHCAERELVTSHNAFGYLAQRYGLHQIAIGGLSPDAEPDPHRLAQVSDLVRSRHVSTIYTETLVSPAVADTVAREAGARTAVLDPIEGITSTSAGSTYLEVMRADLATLRTGQGCR